MLDNHVNIRHTKMTSLISFLRGCYLPSLLRPMLLSAGGFAISSDGYFYDPRLSENELKYRLCKTKSGKFQLVFIVETSDPF